MRPRDRFRGPLLTAAVAAVVAWLAFDGGTYGLTSRSAVAIVAWWMIVVAAAVALVAVPRPPRAAVVALALVAALAVLSLVSAAWSDSAEKAFLEFNRVVLYLGVLLVVVVAGQRSTLARWADGIAIGVAITALFALSSRLLPDIAPSSEAFRFLPAGRERLGYPIGYWNGLAELLAIGVPLLLRAATAGRSSLARALWLAPLPAFPAAIYLTSSRGGALAAGVAVFAFLMLTARRVEAVTGAAIAGLAGIGAVAAVVARPELVNGPLATDLVEREGRTAALLILVACVAAGAVHAAASSLLWPRLPGDRRSERALVAGILATALVAFVAIDPVARFREFRSPVVASGASGDYIREHFLSASGNGRWQLWTAAVDEFRAHPLLGDGAGSFQAWWERHRDFPLFVRYAHSLYFQMLGELGAVGLFLVAAVVGLGVACGVARARRTAGDDRMTTAALAAAFAAFAFAAASDWVWELTVIGIVGFAIVALLTGHGTAPPRRSAGGTHFLSPRIRVAVVLGGLALIALQAIPMLAEIQIGASQQEARRGDVSGARRYAIGAKRLQPWSPSPYLQLALIEEEAGRLHEAREWIGEAIERDEGNWELWLIAARLETEAGAIEAARSDLARATDLNPLWRRALAFEGTG